MLPHFGRTNVVKSRAIQGVDSATPQRGRTGYARAAVLTRI
jgi:hypothetical protein